MKRGKKKREQKEREKEKNKEEKRRRKEEGRERGLGKPGWRKLPGDWSWEISRLGRD
jgi:hypothetical protein